MQKPLVSVIIPVFNRQELIKRTLESLLEQTYSRWECLVVDDGSTDNSLEVLKNYAVRDSRFKFWSRQREPKGAPTCRNIGLQYAKGEFIIFLDSDDYLLPHCLEQRVDTALTFPENDFWVFPMLELKVSGKLRKKVIDKKQNHLKEFLSANILWQTMCPLWKNEILLKLNGFKEGYPRFNDPELMIRAFLNSTNNYLVVDTAKPDSVLSLTSKSVSDFYLKVYESLNLFIPDTVGYLKEAGKEDEIKYLVMYLWLWIKYYYAPNPSGKFIRSVKLIRNFYKLGILTKMKYLSLMSRLLYFHLTKILHLGLSDKLTNRGYYS